MIIQVRAARPSIILDGTDYYSSLAPYLISLDYVDNCDGKKADDLNIDLADRDGKFIAEWMPKKGAFLDAGIIAERWFAPNAASLTLDCGRFWIDSINFELPARKVSVKATSIPTGIRLKASKESRGWEDASLKDIANQIAQENHMTIDWQAQINPRYRRTEQHDESGLGFLKKRCNKAKLAIKVHRNKIVIFDEQKLEEAEPAFTLLYGDLSIGGLISSIASGGFSGFGAGGRTYRMAAGHFSTKVTDTTKKSRISHIDPETGEVRSGTHTAPSDEGDDGEETDDETDDKENDDTDTEDGPTGISVEPDPIPQRRALIEVREGEEGNDVWNKNEADSGSSLAAKAHNREKNKDKNTASVELSIGNPLIAAGQTFNLQGCGQFDGKWFIQSAKHSVGPDYKTELTIRKCLQGY